MSQLEERPTVCPECQGELIKEPYEEYLYCPDCGWDEDNGTLFDPDLPVDDEEILLLDDDIDFDPNLDPEAGEDA